MNDDHDNEQTDKDIAAELRAPEKQPWTKNPVYNRSTACASVRKLTPNQVDTSPCEACGHVHPNVNVLGDFKTPCIFCVANLSNIAAHDTDELTELAGQIVFKTVQHTKQLNLLLEQINLLTEVVNRLIDRDNNTPQDDKEL